MPQSDGHSKREHLESIQRQTGETPPDLKMPKMPKAGMRIKHIFDNLQAGRQGNNPFSYQDIYYYCELTGEQLSHYESTSLRVLDLAYLNKITELQNARIKK